MISREIVESFESIIRYPLTGVLSRYATFIDRGQKLIYGYYSGTIANPNADAFTEFNEIKALFIELNNAIEVNKTRLRTNEHWAVLELLESIAESILTIDNYSKWTRSSITKNNFKPEAEIEYITKQNQSLEYLSGAIGDLDPDNNWVSIALRNRLREEDYGTEGGVRLTTSYRNKRSVEIGSIVDNPQGEKIYGLDYSNKLTFKDNDLLILSHRETVQQSVNVLANLRQGDNPEFRDRGVQTSLLVGSNRNSINYPILLRQFFNSFAEDDTLQRLSVTNVNRESDSISIEFTIQTRLGEDINTETLI